SLRHHGWSPSDRYEDMPRPAFNYRLSDVLGALGIPQLRRLDELHASYERIAAGYAERLAHLDLVLPDGSGRRARLAGLRRPGRPSRRGDGRPPRPGRPVPDRH